VSEGKIDDGLDFDAVLKYCNANFSYGLVSKINATNWWWFREWVRFEMGTYQYIRGLAEQLPDVNPREPRFWHALHRSKDFAETEAVAFTASGKHGRYLTKFYPELGVTRIQELVARAKDGELDSIVGGKAIANVYMNGGIQSCMVYRPDNGRGNFRNLMSATVHPAEAYGDGWELMVIRRSGAVRARALVYALPSGRKIWVRAYGPELETLSQRLLGMKYPKVDGWAGAKLTVVRDDEGGLVSPFLDGGHRWGRFVDGGTKVEILGGNINSTKGLVSYDHATGCAHGCHTCNEYHNPTGYDMATIGTRYRVKDRTRLYLCGTCVQKQWVQGYDKDSKARYLKRTDTVKSEETYYIDDHPDLVEVYPTGRAHKASVVSRLHVDGKSVKMAGSEAVRAGFDADGKEVFIHNSEPTKGWKRCEFTGALHHPEYMSVAMFRLAQIKRVRGMIKEEVSRPSFNTDNDKLFAFIEGRTQ
jgi:hypothetical protein